MPGYISEYDHYGNSPEFIELAFPAGTDVAAYEVVIYGSDGRVDHTISLSSLTLQSTVRGTDVYVIDATTPGFSGIEMGDSTALADDTGAIVPFITHTGAVTAVDGPAAGETSTYIGTASGTTNSLQSDDGGQSYYVQSSTNPGRALNGPPARPCLTVGQVKRHIMRGISPQMPLRLRARKEWDFDAMIERLHGDPGSSGHHRKRA